jgi:hypothetical protein
MLGLEAFAGFERLDPAGDAAIDIIPRGGISRGTRISAEHRRKAVEADIVVEHDDHRERCCWTLCENQCR